MQFEDEKIIALRNEAVKKQYNSIETGIYAGDELITFKEFRLFDDRMSIMLPESFTDMDPELAKKKYPSENRPQIIKTNSSGTVNFMFNLFEQPLDLGQVINAKQQFKSILTKTQPANLFHGEEDVKNGKSIISWFDFDSYALDDTIYNIVFITSIENKMMMGFYNCPVRLIGRWEMIIKEVLNTITDLTMREK